MGNSRGVGGVGQIDREHGQSSLSTSSEDCSQQTIDNVWNLTVFDCIPAAACP